MERLVYKLYHQELPVTEHNVHNFKHAADITANSLEEAWLRAQNDFSDVYAKLKIRSAMVGDLFVDPNGKLMLIAGRGFDKVPELLLPHIKLT